MKKMLQAPPITRLCTTFLLFMLLVQGTFSQTLWEKFDHPLHKEDRGDGDNRINPGNGMTNFNEQPAYANYYYHTGADYGRAIWVGGNGCNVSKPPDSCYKSEDSGIVDIVAAASGRVVYVYNGDGDNHGEGKTIRLRHFLKDGSIVYTQYCHLYTVKPTVEVGDFISGGQIMGTMGRTGSGAGKYVHLHFEVKTVDTLGSSGTTVYYGYTPQTALNFGFLNPSNVINSNNYQAKSSPLELASQISLNTSGSCLNSQSWNKGSESYACVKIKNSGSEAWSGTLVLNAYEENAPNDNYNWDTGKYRGVAYATNVTIPANSTSNWILLSPNAGSKTIESGGGTKLKLKLVWISPDELGKSLVDPTSNYQNPMITTIGSGTLVKTIQYSSGWNSFSAPVQGQNASVILTNKSTPYYVYNVGFSPFGNGANSAPFPENGTNSPNSSILNSMGDFPTGQGFFVKLPAGASATWSGNALNEITLNLRQGWNLVGGISEDISLWYDVTTSVPDCIYLSRTYWFDPTGKSFYQGIGMQAGKGYFIKATTNCTMTIKKTNTFSKTESIPEMIPLNDDPTLSNLSKISIVDGEGASQNLFLGLKKHGIDEYLYQMPPAAPFEVFDARFADNTYTTILDKTNETKFIRVQTGVYPITISWKPIDTGSDQWILTDGENGKLIGTHSLNQHGKIVLSNAMVSTLALKKVSVLSAENEIPQSVRIEGVYPNPFSSHATIKYHLPTTQEVKVVIYDVLGREIQTLTDAIQPQGVNEIVWDGKTSLGEKVRSGIYFCKIKTNETILTQSMVVTN